MIDIRTEIENLGDDAPFVLLPLRLETLFVTVDDAPQLWVRVYPDDCWITAFDPAFTDAERANGQVYWAQRWAARGRDADVRAAWAGLVGAHGAGRAAWIVRQLTPAELGAMPTTGAPELLTLVAAGDSAVPSAVRDAAEAFWTKVWSAGATPAAEVAAADQLAGLSEADVARVTVELRPRNLAADPPAGLARDEVTVEYQVLTFGPTAARTQSFSQAPQVPLFPHQLRLVGVIDGKTVLDEPGEEVPQPLYAGPEPTAQDPELAITSDADGELKVGEKLAWLFDFDVAVKRGLGFKVKLEPFMAERGFDRLFVLGIHVSDTEEGANRFEDLLLRHRYSAEDFEFVAVGSPTNNTDGHPTTYQRVDDPAVSFAAVHRATPLQIEAFRFADKTDGQRFSEVSGLSMELVQATVGAERHDAADAVAMNSVLWPATLGYFIEAMLATKHGRADRIVADAVVPGLREFFLRYVAGRGPAPAVRVGRQPYGVITTTAFSRIRWTEQPPTGHTNKVAGLLAAVLEVLRGEWLSLAERCAHLPDPESATAADVAGVLGLQPSSAAMFQRYAEPVEARYHLTAYSHDTALMSNVRAMMARVQQEMVDVLSGLGYRDGVPPDLATKLFRRRAYPLKGPLVWPAPLSERDGLPPLREFGINYLVLLAELAEKDLDVLRLEADAQEPPDALLYLMAKFALERGYQRRANELLLRAGLTEAEVATRRFEPPYVHVGEKVSASRWRDLFAPLPALTGDPHRLLHEFVTEEIHNRSAGELNEQIDALRRLADLPSAALHRLTAEHIDLCSYRLDAWLTGLVAYQLDLMRTGGDPSAPELKRGAYVGAYGWLEHVRPEAHDFTPVEIADPAVRDTFKRSLDTLVHDAANGGFIAAPSLDHATTAAVLRAGYISNAHRDEPDMLAVNVTSERTRRALVLLEGIRAGQGLGELLGYQLERNLHDRGVLQIHTVIYALRAAFPLRSGRLADTAPPAGTPVEAIDARNVVDGQRLLDQARVGGMVWPYGAALPPAPVALTAMVDAEVARLDDLYDAVADLALAEGVHQLLAGNPERAAATLDAFSQGGLPPNPDVVASPRRHLGITHQVVLHLDPAAAAGGSPRATVEPGLNAWLASALPPVAQIGAVVRVTNPVGGAVTEEVVTAADLGLEPLDLLMILDPEAEGLMGALDDLLAERALANLGFRPDASAGVVHTEPIAGMVTFFQLSAAVAELRPLLLGARPLRMDDIDRAVRPSSDAVTGPRPAVEPLVDQATRIDGPLAALRAARDAVAVIRDRLAADRAAAAAAIDAECAAVAAACLPLDGFGIAVAGRAQIRTARQQLTAGAIATAASLRMRMNDRVAEFDARVAEIGALAPGMPVEEVVARWIATERLVSTVATQERDDVDALRDAVMARVATFAARRDDLFDVIGAPTITTVAGVVAAMDAARAAEPSYAELFGEDLDTATVRTAIDTLVDDLIRQCTAVVAEADRRITSVEGHLAAGATVEAGPALFGDGTPVIGRFDVSGAVTAHLDAALGDQPSLFAHAVNVLGMDDPVRDWRFGVARVRPAVWRWEAAESVLGALRHRLGAGEPAALDVAAMQLPRQAGEPWFAVEYPPATVIDHDAVCYTSVNPAPLAAVPSTLTGLVLDEWPELIPLPERTTGLAVHHDRPGSEPPQAWLVVTPPTWDGRWHWDDLVAALGDTLDLARVRAVEPDLVDQSQFGSLLPATVFPVYPVQISMTLNLALNTAEFRKFREI